MGQSPYYPSLFQLLPLPIGMLKVFSPATAALYEKLGFSSGFHSLTQSIYSTTATQLQWGAYAGAFVLVATFCPAGRSLKNRQWILTLVTAIFAIALLEAVYGLYSGLNHIDSFLWFDRPTGPGVVSGTWINPDHFAGFMNMGILCSLGLFTAYWGISRKKGRRTKNTLLAFASSGRGVYLWLFVLSLLVMLLASTFENLREAFILWEDINVVYRVSSCDVEKHEEKNCLRIRPSPDLHMAISRDALADIEHRCQVKIDGETYKGCHS